MAEAADEAQQDAILAVASKVAAEQFSELAGGAAKAQQVMFEQFIQLAPEGPVPGPEAGKGMIFVGANGRAITIGGDGEVIIINEDGGAMVGDIVNFIVQDIARDVEEHLVEDIPIMAHTVLNDNGTLTHATIDNDYVETSFAETVTGANGGGNMSGGSGNTNFYFPWASLSGGSGGTYNITDTGGINQISFDGMDNVKFYVDATSSTSGIITVYSDQFGTPATWATITYTNISQFLLADVTVSSFSTTNFQTVQSGNVLKLSSLSAGQEAYGIAGTDGAGETFTISGSYDVVAFGKGGADTFDISSSGSGHLLGGAGADTFNFTSFSNSWNVDGGSDGSVDHYNYAGWGTTAYLYASAGGTLVQDASLGNTPSAVHSLTMDSPDTFTGSSVDDFIYVTSGTYGTINGDTGNDTFTLTGGTVTALNGTSGTNTYTLTAGATVTTLTGGSAVDNVTIDSTHLAQSVTFDGGGGVSDTLTIMALSGSTVNLTSTTATLFNFETTTVTGASAVSSGVTLIGYNGAATTLVGSGYGDNITGNGGGNTLTGGGGGIPLFTSILVGQAIQYPTLYQQRTSSTSQARPSMVQTSPVRWMPITLYQAVAVRLRLQMQMIIIFTILRPKPFLTMQMETVLGLRL
ncbi:MAG: hypothetical protein JKY27_11975 [Magnetovibrio sp.]|nr:hypothetical protein [Magnetovibrio sp.]